MSVRTLIFLHGWTMRGAVFDDQIARLGPAYRCLAPDLPGHGARRDQQPSLDAAASLLQNLLNGCETPVLLVGWSMGAAVAWRYLERFGTARIAGLMTIDMSPHMPCGADWPHGLIGQDQTALRTTATRLMENWPGMANAIASTMFGRPQGGEAMSRDEALAQVLRNDPAVMRQCWEDLTTADARHMIGGIALPYLVANGAHSRVYPQSASDWLAANAPDARRHVFARSGHSPHLEEPAAFAKCIADFAATLG